MLLQGHATAALLWMVSRRLCLGQDESRRVQSGPCQHSRSWVTTSSDLFFGRPRPRWPCTCQLCPILLTWPKYRSPTVDILAQLQSVEDVFVSDVVPSCHSLNLSQTHLKDLESVLLCRLECPRLWVVQQRTQYHRFVNRNGLRDMGLTTSRKSHGLSIGTHLCNPEWLWTVK